MQRRWTIGAEPVLIAIAALVAIGLRAAHHGSDITSDTALAIALGVLTRRWIRLLGNRLTDTEAERRELQERTAQCLAGTFANNALRERLRADAEALQKATEQRIADAEARADQRIAEETAAVRREFEETRTVELCQAYELGALNEREGIHQKTVRKPSEVIILSQRRQPSAGTARS